MKPLYLLQCAALALMPACMHAQGLQIRPGAWLVAKGAPMLVLHNCSFTNGGIFKADSGSVLFSADMSGVSPGISGDSATAFYNLNINDEVGDVTMNNDVSAAGSVLMENGNLQLNGFTLSLGETGSIAEERNAACVTDTSKGGMVTAMAVLDAPSGANPGNLGAKLTSGEDLGMTTVARGNVRQIDSAGITGIQRYYVISPAVNGGLNATLRFYYLDHELGGDSKDNLALYYDTILFNMHTVVAWIFLGTDASSTDSDWVQKDNVDFLGGFTLANASGTPAPAVLENASVYPNPTPGPCKIVIRGSVGKYVVLELYDEQGHILGSSEVYCVGKLQTVVDWDLSRFPAGIYYVVFRNLNAPPAKIIKD